MFLVFLLLFCFCGVLGFSFGVLVISFGVLGFSFGVVLGFRKVFCFGVVVYRAFLNWCFFKGFLLVFFVKMFDHNEFCFKNALRFIVPL